MPCYHPSRVQVRRKSTFPCLRLTYTQIVPCGSCLGCRQEQSRQWAVRIIHEAQVHAFAWFITLTYRESELPANGSLHPPHFRQFIKALRRKHPSGSISYFGCGEYGDTTQRPHYHAVLFGADFLDSVPHPDTRRSGVWWSQTLDDTWGRGRTELGTVTMASASYVAGYVQKKVRGSDHVRANPLTGELLEQEFARMSLNPAVGRRWIERHWRDVYPRDFVVVDGVECKPPRYYDKFMDLADDKGGSEERRQIMEEVRQRRWDESEELDRYELHARETLHKARNTLFAGRQAV